MNNSVGDKIKTIANILWYASVVIVIAITIAISTWVYNYVYGGTAGSVFVIVLVGVFMIFVNYVLKLVLEGYGELIADTKEIKEKLNKA